MKTLKFSKNVRLMGYCLLILTYTIFHYTQMAMIANLGGFNNLFRILAVIILLFGMLFQKYSFRELVFFCGIFLFSIFVAYQNKSLDFPITVAIIFCLRKIEFSKIVKADFYTRFVITLIIFVCAVSNYIPSNNFFRDGVIRYSFGFYHPNLFGAYVLILTLEFIYLGHIRNNNTLRIWIILPIIFFIDKTANSRSAEVSLLIYLIVYLIFKINFFSKVSNKILYCASIVAICLVSTLSVISTYMYNPTSEIWGMMNKLLSSRPAIINSVVNNFYPVHLFGQRTALLGDMDGIFINGRNINLFVDNSYMSIAIKLGAVTLAVFVLWLIKNAYIFTKGKNRIVMFCWLISLLVWGLSENKLILIQFNILLFSYVEKNEGEITCKNI
ncbi:hypothetical protein [Pediococcus pentosaceus]|uniref:Polysaccharide polymerase n=1 Tax=Pediococcus pentosaceus TaxID=1255 RepID=A0ABQ6XEX6_PEDPE|nr:hypothetical protein [Pediococcus pentosaceus]KAF0412435.1 hypothetical protein GBO79_09025 [Pediococcus pentosaceus]KAF0501425.1 hypothetical protein GBP22_08755 [Pediococcus pentosaceus]